jgi:hypothetical protein
MYCVTEFDWLNRTAIGEIFAVYPCAYKQSEHEHKPEQGWLLRGLERIENRDRQFVPPSFWGKSLPVSWANYKFCAAFVLDMFPGCSPQQESANPEAGDTQHNPSLRRGGDFGTFSLAFNALRRTEANHENSHPFGIFVAYYPWWRTRCPGGWRRRQRRNAV